MQFLQASKEASRDSHRAAPGGGRTRGNTGAEGERCGGRESQGKHACCASRGCGCSMALKGEKGENFG